MDPKLFPSSTASIYNVFGIITTVFIPSQATGGAYTSMQFVVPPNAGPPPHYHPNIDESFTVLDGAFEIMVGDDVVRCGPGDSVFVPRGVVHTFANIAATPSRFLSISNPGGHEQFFAGIDELIRSGNFDQTEILKLCEEHGVVPVVP